MSSTLQTKSVISPDLSDVLTNLKQDIFSTLNCVKIGSVKQYDATKKTAQVQICFKRVLPDSTLLSYPLLIDVPVFTLQGGGGYVQVPVSAGDECLLLFSDRRIDEWFVNGAGQQSAPGDPRMHDLSDGIALVGINALNSTLPATPTNKVRIGYTGGTIEIDASSVKLVGVAGAEIDLAGAIVTIRNGTTTLLTQMQTLISAIEAIQVTGPLSLTPASVAALEAVKLQMATLLG
jgi:hypothetical protein